MQRKDFGGEGTARGSYTLQMHKPRSNRVLRLIEVDGWQVEESPAACVAFLRIFLQEVEGVITK